MQSILCFRVKQFPLLGNDFTFQFSLYVLGIKEIFR